jgi:hypothetical protein
LQHKSLLLRSRLRLGLDDIQRAARRNPLDLVGTQRVLSRDLQRLATVLLLHDDLDFGGEVASEESVEAFGGDDVAGGDERVIGVVGEGEGSPIRKGRSASLMKDDEIERRGRTQG